MSEMEKIMGSSPEAKSLDITNQNIEQLKQLFPDVFSEGKIDFEALRAVLGEEIDDSEERYNFTWNGKTKARQIAQTPSTGTLRPCKDESVNWDTTENLFIEGDNLEVLKLLQKSYHKKVKMIYIDPPYNTGKDFVYKDNFHNNIQNYLEQTGQVDSEGNKLSTNSDTSGRYHSDWLNMIYPRLKLARNLLSDDGVIFISIDDCEQSRLKVLCDEIFGEDNFIGLIIREAIKGGSVSSHIREVHDYVLVYSKNRSLVSFSGYEKPPLELNLSDDIGPYARGRELNKWGAGSRREDSPSMWFPIEGPNGEEVYPIRNDGSEGRWRLGRVKMREAVEKGNVIFEKRDNGTYIAYEKIRDSKTGITQFTTLFKDKYINAKGTERIKSLFSSERSYFDYAKPTELIYDLMKMADIGDNDIVLDFFAGSGTTADSVQQYANDHEFNVKFILVQLPEVLALNAEARKLEVNNISELTLMRIKNCLNAEQSCGVKVFKLSETNIRPWDADFENLEQVLQQATKSIKDGRSSEDILYEIFLKYGYDLTTPVETEVVNGKNVYVVGAGALFVCLDDEITTDTVEGIAKLKEEYDPETTQVVFKDEGFADDRVKTNAIQILKQAAIDDVKSI